MSLVHDAYKALIKIGLRASCNAYISHLPTDVSGRDYVKKHIDEAETWRGDCKSAASSILLTRLTFHS